MNKKTIFVIIFISLFLTLPAFSGQATVSPEEIGGSDLSTDAVYNYSGNSIEIIEQTSEATRVLLNDTYQLDIEHNTTNVGVECTKLDLGPPGLTAQADEMLFDIDFATDVDGQHITIALPELTMSLDVSGENSDLYEIVIVGEQTMDISYNKTEKYFSWTDGSHTIEQISNTTLVIDGGFLLFDKLNSTTWMILTPSGPVLVNYNSPTLLHVDFGGIPLHNGPFPPGPLPAPWFNDGIFAIDFDGNSVTISGPGFTICVSTFSVVLIFDYMVITWYYGLLIERVVILVWDITIIIYISIVELLIVIIYYTFEIKIYETSVVIVYESIEIIFVFISILIWELTFIFHFEFWFIEIVFIINLVLNIIVIPVRFIFIPIIIPVFIPVIYYVPVLIKEYIHVYVPYASPALYIDVFDQVLQKPNHTIQYLVTDAAGIAVDDATVTVDYNGTDYPATFIANGVYEVELPASDEDEFISVSAVKAWYPMGLLDYYLEVDWITETVTVTAPTPLPIVSVIASLIALSVGTMVINKKKKK
ncbi:MAG: hypothetical protein ACTSXA_00060 [Candidatus Heimdallarchaeota archaeon]